jgi:hypothetical protein
VHQSRERSELDEDRVAARADSEVRLDRGSLSRLEGTKDQDAE